SGSWGCAPASRTRATGRLPRSIQTARAPRPRSAMRRRWRRCGRRSNTPLLEFRCGLMRLAPDQRAEDLRWAVFLERNAAGAVVRSGVLPRTSMRPPRLRKAAMSLAMVSWLRLSAEWLALVFEAVLRDMLLLLRCSGASAGGPPMLCEIGQNRKKSRQIRRKSSVLTGT